ncbi:MAG: hypothetical protein KA793_07850 [Bacteroidales bacterium]|nr:hypothetical protein [Bacteroidales bacterium]
MKAIRLLVLTTFFLFPVCFLHAQYLEDSPTPKQRIFYGGNFGMNFGTVTVLDISPEIGYRISNRLSAGLGATYIYYRDNVSDEVFNIWGLRQFASFTLIKDFSNILPFGTETGGLLLYGELNSMNLYNSFLNPSEPGRYWVVSPLAGPAYQLRIGARSYMLIMLLYNFNETTRSPLDNPVFRITLQF